MKFLFDGDGVLGVERWLGAGSFLDEVGFSVKACSLRQWRLENLSDSRGFESGLRVVRLVGWLIFSLAPHDLVSGCFDVGVRFGNRFYPLFVLWDKL
ncbi:unnamed protein product [Brassica oleracea]